MQTLGAVHATLLATFEGFIRFMSYTLSRLRIYYLYKPNKVHPPDLSCGFLRTGVRISVISEVYRFLIAIIPEDLNSSNTGLLMAP